MIRAACPLLASICKHCPPKRRRLLEIEFEGSGEGGRLTRWIRTFIPWLWCLPCASCCRVPTLPQQKATSSRADCSWQFSLRMGLAFLRCPIGGKFGRVRTSMLTIVWYWPTLRLEANLEGATYLPSADCRHGLLASVRHEPSEPVLGRTAPA